MSLPHTWRPFGVRLAGVGFGGATLVLAVVAWFALPPDVRDTFSTFQRITMLFLVLLAGAAGFALCRSRAVATEQGLTVVNGYKRRDFEWAELVAVHLPPGAPWAMLDLADGETCPVMAIQGSDGKRAREAVSQIRTLIS
jgi:hypothetical protein